MKPTIKVSIGCFSHATEDQNKVIKAMLNLIGFYPGDPKRKQLLGHWKNPITLIEFELEEKDSEFFITKLREKLKEEERRKIINSLEERTDEKGRIHLRFDKQKAYIGEIEGSTSDDVIKVVISSTKGRKENISFFRKIME